MPKPQTKELELLESICHRIVKTRRLPSQRGLKLYPLFQKRYQKAVKIVEDRLVSKYTFNPSGRVVWTVKGKSGEYQIMPETNFCSCDDFYFRVMGYKRQVCYHIIAQKIASSLKLYNEYKLRDSDYDGITEKWTLKEPHATKE
jgi:predicted nucleic acid-binding Zn finger protein